MDQLRLAVFVTEGLVPTLLHTAKESRQESATHILGKGEIGFPVAGVQIVVKDATDAPRTMAVGYVKIIIRPSLEARVICGVMFVAMSP